MADAETTQFILMIALSLILTFCAAAQEAAPSQAQGVTVPLDRHLESKLADARDLLDSGQTESAIALLQSVLEADPSALVHSQDPLLCRGASMLAGQMLAELDPSALAARDKLVSRHALAALQRALTPPDRVALQKLATRYAGSDIGKRARLALDELAQDRGFLLSNEQDRWALSLPFYQDENDPALPLVEAKGLRPLWRFDFRNPEIGQLSRNHRMTFGEGLGYVSNGVELVALNLGNGEPVWRFEGDPKWESMSHSQFREIFAGYNSDTLTMPVLEDGILLAVMQEPLAVGRFDTFNRAPGWSSIPVRRKLPARRLYAFDAQTGRLLWRQQVAWLGQSDPEPRGLVAAPPAAANGRVFLPVYDAVGTIDLAIQALDLYTGQPLWKTYLVSGQQETNLFGNILREMASQPPAADQNRVVFTSNLGTISALEADSGRTLWSRLYKRTRFRTRQDGAESRRAVTFANGQMAVSDQRLLCAPRDSNEAFLVDLDSGQIIRSWPFQSTDYGVLKYLVAATQDGAWFHGTHLVFLPFPATFARPKRSIPLYSLNSVSASWHSGALARGEFLAPATELVRILSPSNLQGKNILKGLAMAGSELGSVQVAPGLAFIIRPGGITAFSSPQAILNSLAHSPLDAASLTRILPYLEGVDMSDQSTALKVTDRAVELANLAPNKELAERLYLVAARGYFTLAESDRALRLLNDLFTSSNSDLQFKSAELALDVLERSDPAQPKMDRVLGILERSGRTEITRSSGLREGLDIALARARVLQQGKRSFGGEKHLDALLSLLELDQLGGHLQGQVELEDWARNQLRAILDHPITAARLERRAKRAFQLEAPSDSLLRRYAGTQAAWNWLQLRAEQAQKNRQLSVQVARWLRNFDWPQRTASAPLIDPDLLIGSAYPDPIPGQLAEINSIDLGNARILDFDLVEGGARILLKESSHLVLMDLGSDKAKQSPGFRLTDDPRDLPADLRNRSFTHEAGATVILDWQWIQLYPSGEVRRISLPGRATEFLRLGNLLAFLCNRGDSSMELQVRDLLSGDLLLQMPVPLRSDRFHRLAWNGEELLLFQDQTAQTLLVPLFHSGANRTLPLPTSPGTRELDAIIPLPDGYVLPYYRRSRLYLQRLDGPHSTSIPQPNRSVARTFLADTGYGWLQQPMAPGSGGSPPLSLIWPGAGDPELNRMDFAHGDLRFPQLEGYTHKVVDLKLGRLLTLSSGPDRSLRIQQWDLPQNTQPKLAWSLDMPDLKYDGLVGRLPAPAIGADGWLLPLKFRGARHQEARSVNLLIDRKGQVLDRLELKSSSNSSLYIEPILKSGRALLRHEKTIYLLGDQE
jgi:outer membrane protein assembly factor BamB